jgi:hypothetical protein
MTKPTRPIVLLVLLAGAAVPLYAQSPDALRPFAPLVGGVWVAEGEATSLGRYSAERTHEWVLDGRYLRVRQRLEFTSGTIIDEDLMIGWDPQAQKLRLWSFASDGSTGDGFEEPAPGANRMVFAGRMHGPRASEWRTTTFLIDESSFSVLVEIRSGKDWTPAMTLAYRKRRPEGGHDAQGPAAHDPSLAALSRRGLSLQTR